MEASTGRLYDRRITGQSDIYPNKPMATTHFLGLVDPSTSRGFTNYQRANMRQMELQTQTLSSQYAQHDQYNASPSTSYGSHLIEKVPMTLQDLSHVRSSKTCTSFAPSSSSWCAWFVAVGGHCKLV
jgi:hypothetical protein